MTEEQYRNFCPFDNKKAPCFMDCQLWIPHPTEEGVGECALIGVHYIKKLLPLLDKHMGKQNRLLGQLIKELSRVIRMPLRESHRGYIEIPSERIGQKRLIPFKNIVYIDTFHDEKGHIDHFELLTLTNEEKLGVRKHYCQDQFDDILKKIIWGMQ